MTTRQDNLARARAEHTRHKRGEELATRYGAIHLYLQMGTWQFNYKGNKSSPRFAATRTMQEAKLMGEIADLKQQGYNAPSLFERFDF